LKLFGDPFSLIQDNLEKTKNNAVQFDKDQIKIQRSSLADIKQNQIITKPSKNRKINSEIE